MNEINLNVLKQLIKIVEKRIKHINNNIALNQETLKRVNGYDDLINLIKDDNTCFALDTFYKKLDDLLNGIVINDRSKLEALLEKVNYLKVIAFSIKGGHYTSFDEQEIVMIDEVIELITYFKGISFEQKIEQRSNVSKSNEELTRCTALYDKLRNGEEGLEHFDTDLTYLMQLVKEKDPTLLRDTLALIQILSKRIHENIMKQVQDEELPMMDEEFEEPENNEIIDEELIKGVFEKYGFNFDFFDEKHKKILMRLTLRRIESVLEVLHNNEEYQFVKNYQRYPSKKTDLFMIIRHASKETLEYLIIDAKKRGVTVQEIFGVTGVYKKVPKNGVNLLEPPIPGPDYPPVEDEYLPGTYEYYRKNADLFENLSLKFNAENPGLDIDFFKHILLSTPEVLATPSHVVAKNIELALQYGVKMIRRGEIGVRPHAATMFDARHFEEIADILIENGLYNYLITYPSVVRDEKFVRKILYRKYNGTLEMNPNGTIKEVRMSDEPHDLNDVVNKKNLSPIVHNVPDEIVAFVNAPNNKKLLKGLQNDEVMDRMDSNEQIRTSRDVAYSINGVLVSRPKFRKIWYLMTMSGHISRGEPKNLLMYALTYNSYYRDEDLQILQEFVNGFNFGGIALWNI